VLVAIVSALYVVVWPFVVTRYAPMTDLPFHAAHSSTFRHYFDPTFHQREQFEVHPLAVPYLSMYAIAAFLMIALPAALAIKCAAVVMLALLPVGLGVLFHGMKKSPLLGLLGLGMVWSLLTHWGFLNFVGAIGLFAMSVGLALLVVDKPTRGRRIGLALVLVALFFTHIFRFPFAIAAVLGTAIVMYPATRRLRPVLLPIVPSLVLFVGWWFVRPKALEGSFGPFALHTERFAEMKGLLFGGFVDPAEAEAVGTMTRVLVVVACVTAVAFVAEGRLENRRTREWAFGIGATVVVASCALVFLGLFLWLPMQMGLWWYVYPREAIATVFIALGLMPDLPRSIWLRAPVVLALAIAPLVMARVVTRGYRVFDDATRDFDTITRKIPKAPKLLYLIFDHGGSTRSTTPFIHLPAYVQAEQGGWLSFHFAVWGASPLTYRAPSDPGAVVPPPVPLRWEWRPDLFDVRTRGPFFDWFLVRRRDSPDALFRADPSIERVDHVGNWWLYHRR
jgi:hypothetical protein